MPHAIFSQCWQNSALYGPLFATMSHVRRQISILMPDSCAESYGDSFDTHHDHVMAKEQKSRPYLNLKPGFEHDTRVKVLLSNLSYTPHIVSFQMRYLTLLYVKRSRRSIAPHKNIILVTFLST